MAVKNVIFDLDGTLLYTLQDLCNAVNFVLGKYGEPERSLSEVRSFVGNGVHKLMERSVPAGTSAESIEQQYQDFKPFYEAHSKDTTKPFDGIPELLAELHRRGIGVGVVTNKFQGAAEPLMEDYFGDLIDVTVGSSERLPHKPASPMVYKAIHLLVARDAAQGRGADALAARGRAAADSDGRTTAADMTGKDEAALIAESSPELKAGFLYVGDSTVDAETAENAGLSYLLCDWGYNDRDVLEQQHAVAVVSSPEQILDYLN